MPNTSKSSKKNPTANGAAATEFVDAITPLYLNGVERMAEMQKKSLELAAEQTNEWVNAWKKAFSFFPVTPATAFSTSRDRHSRLTSRPKRMRSTW